jgi:hypothetical protein
MLVVRWAMLKGLKDVFDTSPTWVVLVACSVLARYAGVWRRSSVG